MKKIVGILMCLLILTAVNVQARDVDEEWCDEDFCYWLDYYEDTIWIKDYIGPGGDVVIPAVVDSKPVTHILDHAFGMNITVTSVIIPDSVTYIGWGAFDDCSNLTSMTFGNGLQVIDMSAFSGCTGLTTLTLPDSVIDISSAAFQGCTGLTSVTIPDSVTDIGHDAFSYCDALSSVYFLGDVPSMGSQVFRKAALDFNICYTPEATGFTTPTWEGYPASACACIDDSDCGEGYVCLNAKCIEEDNILLDLRDSLETYLSTPEESDKAYKLLSKALEALEAYLDASNPRDKKALKKLRQAAKHIEKAGDAIPPDISNDGIAGILIVLENIADDIDFEIDDLSGLLDEKNAGKLQKKHDAADLALGVYYDAKDTEDLAASKLAKLILKAIKKYTKALALGLKLST